MTPEKQLELQRSLMTMLGDRSQLDSRDKLPPPQAKSKAIKLSSNVSAETTPSQAELLMPPAPPANDLVPQDNQSNASTTTGIESEADLWACTVCTLLNSKLVNVCVACDSKNESCY